MRLAKPAAASCLLVLIFASATWGDDVEIASLDELAEYAAQSGNTVTMKPGVYKLIEYLSPEVMARRRRQRQFQYITFSGDRNTFNLDGVTIEVDTSLREVLRPPIHSNEFAVSGDGNTLQGLTITNIGEGTSPAGALISVDGERNTLRDCTFHVQGSYPYGYGDLFGKGGGKPTIAHRKKSGVHIVGSETRVIGCKLYTKSFGHGYYVQGGQNQSFEDCYVEGVMRPSDEMLAETSGPAFDVDFRTVVRMRGGVNRVLPGYMKSLSVVGVPVNGSIRGLTFKNCTAKNMRGGFELSTRQGVRLENCTAIGNERGFWVSSDAQVVGCTGDAEFGPLLFVEGEGANVEVTLQPTESMMTVHAVATIYGTGHNVTIKTVTIKTPENKQRTRLAPILIGYTPPQAGEGMAPYSERTARDITLRNESNMPVEVGAQASEIRITSRGELRENRGSEISVEMFR